MIRIIIEIAFFCRKLGELTQFSFRGHELSPIKHLYLKNPAGDRAHTVDLLDVFVDKVMFNFKNLFM